MSPIDDLTYDVITVLQRKAKGLQAYDKYVSDAEADEDDELRDLFEAIRRQDEEHVQQLKEVLAQRLADDLGYEDEEEEEEEDEGYDDDVEEPVSAGAEQIDAMRGTSIGGPEPRRESSYRQR